MSGKVKQMQQTGGAEPLHCELAMGQADRLLTWTLCLMPGKPRCCSARMWTSNSPKCMMRKAKMQQHLVNRISQLHWLRKQSLHSLAPACPIFAHAAFLRHSS